MIKQENLNPNYFVTTEEIKKKKRQKEIYISYDDFLDINLVLKEFENSCIYNTRYSIIVRVCYSNSNEDQIESTREFKSLGEQIYLKFENPEEFNECIVQLQNTIINRINYSMELYKKDVDDIIYFQILIFNVNYTDIVVKKKNIFNVHDLGSHKDLLNVSKTTSALNKTLPLTIDYQHFGNLLEREENFITLKGEKINFLDRINKFLSEEKLVSFDKDLLFYHNLETDKIIIVKPTDIHNIIDVYSMSGIKIQHMVDIRIPNSNNFMRKVGNVSVFVTEKGIKNKMITTNFEPVYPYKIRGTQSSMLHPDWKIGTMDIETFKYSEQISKPYAAGFYADKKVFTFYVDNDLNFDNVILKCLDSMLVEKFHKFIFYIHNLGRFDIAFILNVIIRANEINPDRYKYELVFRDDLILSVNISSKVNKKTYTIKLVDSYNILNASLAKLCETFDTEVKKTYFPYDFVNKDNLFYKGKRPDIRYYNNIDKNIYKNIPKDWSMHDETIKYLSIDLISLYSVIDKFKNEVFIKYNTQVTRSLTISSLAMEIFLRKYYNNNIPLINKTSVYNDIKNSYFGGVSEVYKPFGKDLYYYDVNSLYPFSALNPMPGLNCTFIEKINSNISKCLELNDFFGFYFCEIETSDKYIGLLPVRCETGLVMPLGKIKGWYFSEELKFAFENGYKIHVINGYRFNKVEKVFDKYIYEMYKIKSTTKNPVLRATAKSLLNNLLGRFGLNLEKYITELVSTDKYLEILQCKKVKGNPKFIGDKVLVTHSNEVSKDICDMHNVDFKETYLNDLKSKKKDSKFKNESYHDVSIAIASAVTSYSRIFMSKIKLNILSKGGQIYYTDTDSIVTDIKLDDSLVGTDLGQFKLEHEIKEAYFISTKTYCILDKNNKAIIKAKSVDSKSLELKDFKELYLGSNVKAKRTESIKDFSKGSVTVNVPKNIVLSANVYNKRTKVFENNLWVDTKPIFNNYHTSVHYPVLENISKFSLPKLSIPKLSISIKSIFKKGVIRKLLLLWLIIILMLDSIENSYMYSFPLDMDIYLDLGQDLDNNITDLKPKQNNAINLYRKRDYGYIAMDNLNQIYNTNQNVYSNSNVLNNVFESHLNSVIKEVESANKTISDLKLELMDEKIAHHNYRLEVLDEIEKSNQKREEIAYRINEACTFMDALISSGKKP